MSSENDFDDKSSQQLETLRWQFQLTWKLASGWTLPNLTNQACLWEPAPGSWTVRQSADGEWRPDWAETEPIPAPPVTIGWISWQIIWWWSGMLAAIRNEKPAAHYEVTWPGNADAVMQRLESLASEWTDVLSKFTDDDLERPVAYPWPEPRPLRLALAWVNSELMKNIAEIGCIRHIFEAMGDSS